MSETFINGIKAGAYRIRIGILIIGWMWFIMGAAWVGFAFTLPDGNDGFWPLIWHSLFETLWGAAHMYIYTRAQGWKKFGEL